MTKTGFNSDNLLYCKKLIDEIWLKRYYSVGMGDALLIESFLEDLRTRLNILIDLIDGD
jgi:hypothetical protein